MKLASLILLVIAGTIGTAIAADKPNVLFIVCDDLNTHLSCYGDKIVKTPSVDALASRGVRFDKAYCQYPVCNPSRSSFLTGLRPQTTKVLDQVTLVRKDRMPGVVYLPEHFKTNGYFIAGIGKVEHARHYEIQWDVADDFKAGGAVDEDESPRPRQRRAGTQPTTRRVRTPNKGPGVLPYEVKRATEDNDPENTDDQIAAKVVALLEEKRDKPFFIVAGFHKPHVPHVAPKRYFDLYPLDSIPLTKVPKDDEKDIPQVALASRSNYQPEMTDEKKRDIIAAYYACTSYMDAKVGEVTSAMDRLKLWDNTIVVFIGDHGWHFGEHNWWAKASLFEESARAPLIVVGPKVKPAACERVVEFLDIAPTLVQLCDLPAMPQGEGRSFASLLADPAQAWDGLAFTALGERGRSVTDGRYRYTEWNRGEAGVELYDHESDPGEVTNLANDPAHAGIIKKLSEKLWAVPG